MSIPVDPELERLLDFSDFFGPSAPAEDGLAAPSRQVLRLPAVTRATGLSRSSIYAQIKGGRFPPPIRLSANAVGWLADEVDQWIQDRITERDGSGDTPRR